MKCPKCKSTRVTMIDDSFDHEFGTEVIKYPVCNACGFDDDENKLELEDWEEKCNCGFGKGVSYRDSDYGCCMKCGKSIRFANCVEGETDE